MTDKNIRDVEKKTLDVNTRLDIAALIIAVITAISTTIVTVNLTNRTNQLSKELNKQNIFIGTVSDSVDHLADQNPVRRRLAVINLANSATSEEEVIQVVKAIIITSRTDLESTQDVNSPFRDRKSELGILLKIASLDDEKAKLYEQALTDEEVQELLEMFLPLSRTSAVSEEQIEDVPDPTAEQLPLETQDTTALENQALAIELKSLVSNIYSSNRTTRRTATAILAQDIWRPYDQLLVSELIQAYKKESDNYFGIVNSLHLLNEVSDTSIQENADAINKLAERAKSLLSAQDQSTYLTPIVNRITSTDES
ncbi:MAG: hypothetical protein QNJ46_20330 [Leptolyngbyaceae cyanobacterium MO_188.B28]|nr:hypothetical protein [Leptolyngbyaceae cyanobacterium MO_188.B28]